MESKNNFVKESRKSIAYTLSIITINRNNYKGLKKTIESVVSQDFKDFEWIIIDGNSTDASKDLIEKHSSEIDYWISEPDDGIYNAMNKGIRVSHGIYLLFLNSGDFLYNRKVLENVVPLLIGKDFYVGNEMRPDGLFCVDLSAPFRVGYTIIKNYFPHQSTFIHRRIFEKYGKYREDKKIVSDWALTYKAILLGEATVEKLNYTIAVFNEDGFSFNNLDLAATERQEVLNETPCLKVVMDFFVKYYFLIKKIRGNSILRKIGLFYLRWM